MKVLRGPFETWEAGADHGVAVGVFDGVHLGHRHVLDRLMARSEHLGVAPAVLTFHPHPLQVLAPDRAPRLLTTLEQRLELLDDLGVATVAVLGFTEGVRSMSAAGFVSDILADRLRARLIVAGDDFRFGSGREGDIALLARMGPELGYEMLASPLIGEGEPVSSTRIRSALAAGDVARAAALLGRHHEVRAVVSAVASDGGITRARLAVPGGLAVPGPGAYAVAIDGQMAAAVVSEAGIGVVGALDPVEGSELRVAFVSPMGAEPDTPGG